MDAWPKAGRRGMSRYVRWSPALGEEIVGRVERGASLAGLWRDDPQMPHPTTVRVWAARRPAFGAALAQAQAQARRRQIRHDRLGLYGKMLRRPRDGRGRTSSYRDETGQAICDRLAAGESLTEICAAPGMPHVATVYYWLRRHEAFAEMYAIARQCQADTLLDQMWAVAQAAGPKEVALARLRIEVLQRRMVRLAPQKYGERPSVAAAETQPAAFIVETVRFSDLAPPTNGAPEGEVVR